MTHTHQPENEKLYPLPEAYERATGFRPHPSTCHRHRLRGIQGVRLETARQGGRRLCSVESVLRFNERVTAAADGINLAPQTNRRASRWSIKPSVSLIKLAFEPTDNQFIPAPLPATHRRRDPSPVAKRSVLCTRVVSKTRRIAINKIRKSLP